MHQASILQALLTGESLQEFENNVQLNEEFSREKFARLSPSAVYILSIYMYWKQSIEWVF